MQLLGLNCPSILKWNISFKFIFFYTKFFLQLEKKRKMWSAGTFLWFSSYIFNFIKISRDDWKKIEFIWKQVSWNKGFQIDPNLESSNSLITLKYIIKFQDLYFLKLYSNMYIIAHEIYLGNYNTCNLIYDTSKKRNSKNIK